MRPVLLFVVVVTAAWITPAWAAGANPFVSAPAVTLADSTRAPTRSEGARLAAKAKPKAAPWVALVRAEGEVPSSWTGKLRASAVKAQDRNWVDSPAISLDEAALTLGCASWGPACAAQVAGMTGAQNALLIDIQRKPGASVASVAIAAVAADGTVIPVSSGGSGGDAERVEVSVDDDGLKIAAAWVAGAVKGARPTVLVVTSDLDGTEVVIDNGPVGKTPLTLIDGVPPGSHALLLRREGRAPLSRTIEVKAGTINREHGVLGAGGPAMKSTPAVAPPVDGLPTPPPTTPPATATSDGGIAPLALVGWSLTGVGGAAAVAGTVVGSVLMSQAFSVVDGAGNVTTDLCRNDDGGFSRGGADGCSGGTAVPNKERQPFIEPIAAWHQEVVGQATVAFVVGGAGLLLAGTGAALALTADGEDADATANGNGNGNGNGNDGAAAAAAR